MVKIKIRSTIYVKIEKMVVVQAAQLIKKRWIKCGLKTLHQENQDINRWFKMIFLLTVIPQALVDDHFDKVLVSKPRIDDAIDKKKYNKFFRLFLLRITFQNKLTKHSS